LPTGVGNLANWSLQWSCQLGGLPIGAGSADWQPALAFHQRYLADCQLKLGNPPTGVGNTVVVLPAGIGNPVGGLATSAGNPSTPFGGLPTNPVGRLANGAGNPPTPFGVGIG